MLQVLQLSSKKPSLELEEKDTRPTDSTAIPSDPDLHQSSHRPLAIGFSNGDSSIWVIRNDAVEILQGSSLGPILDCDYTF